MATNINATLTTTHTITHMKVICNYLELNNFATFTADFYTDDPNTSMGSPVHTTSITIEDSYYNDWGSDDNYIITLITNNINEIISTKNYIFATETPDTTSASD